MGQNIGEFRTRESYCKSGYLFRRYLGNQVWYYLVLHVPGSTKPAKKGDLPNVAEMILASGTSVERPLAIVTTSTIAALARTAMTLKRND